jgi:inner membrane protein
MDLLTGLAPWHWLVLALGLFALEVFATSEFFIGIALASLALAGVLAAFPDMSWETQLGLFGFLSVAFSFFYFKFFRGFNEETDAPLLNNRSAQLVGETFALESDITNKGAVMINDTRWQVKCEGKLGTGTRVKVTGAEGMTLILEPAEAG